MKAKAKRIYSLLCAWILSLLGFSSCDDGFKIGGGGKEPIACEYGCPYTEFTLKGTVTDAKSNPIKGIKVTLKEIFEDEMYEKLTEFTDENGKVEYHDGYADIGAFGQPDYVLVFEDVDGTENGGLFSSKTIDVELKMIEEGERWKVGTYESTFTVALDEAKPE